MDPDIEIKSRIEQVRAALSKPLISNPHLNLQTRPPDAIRGQYFCRAVKHGPKNTNYEPH